MQMIGAEAMAWDCIDKICRVHSMHQLTGTTWHGHMDLSQRIQRTTFGIE